MIEVTEVSRWYGDVVALSRVSCRIEPGVTALLGANGAGKSSLIRILAGLQRTSEGQVRVLDRDPWTDRSVFADLGYVPESAALPDVVAPRRFIRALATQRGLADPDHATVEQLRHVGLDPDDPRPIRTYSKGMRQRVKVAAAMVHDPAVLVLDEPLNGLDPAQRVALINLFRQLGAQGRVVLVSTHVLAEVERLASQVLVLVQGRLAAEGDHHHIRDLMDDRPRRIRITCDHPRALGAALVRQRLADQVTVEEPTQLVVDTADAPRLRTELAGLARTEQTRLRAVIPEGEDLDSVFSYLVERGLA